MKGDGRTESLEIREAGVADLPRLMPLIGQLGMDDGRVLDAGEAEGLIDKMKGYPDYRLYVALAGGEAVGVFALLIMDNLGHQGAPSGIVEDVVVRHDRRRRGIGEAMMGFAMDRCREKKCYKMVLSSNRNRADAHEFYRSLGFEIHGLSFEVRIA